MILKKIEVQSATSNVDFIIQIMIIMPDENQFSSFQFQKRDSMTKGFLL